MAQSSPEIRAETSADVDAIRRITELAFGAAPYASGDEHEIVDRLRTAGALSLSLVASIDDEVVAHVAFSPATATDGSHPWYALGPVSVTPVQQRRGIGSMLIERGLATLRAGGALGCVLVGDPNYYQRFGFQRSPQNSPEEDYAEYFMIKRFTDIEPSGAVAFHEAFSGAT